MLSGRAIENKGKRRPSGTGQKKEERRVSGWEEGSRGVRNNTTGYDYTLCLTRRKPRKRGPSSWPQLKAGHQAGSAVSDERRAVGGVNTTSGEEGGGGGGGHKRGRTGS